MRAVSSVVSYRSRVSFESDCLYLSSAEFEKIALYASEILQGKSLCQQDPDVDDGDVEEADADSSEYESALISNASDLVGALASVLGPDFAGPFGQFLPLIRKYYVSRSALRKNSTRERALIFSFFPFPLAER